MEYLADDHYDYVAAKITLEDFVRKRTQHDVVTTPQLLTLDMNTVHVRDTGNANCLKLCDNEQSDSSVELTIVRVQGLLCEKLLPPIGKPTSIASMQRKRPHIRQAVTITGIDSADFDSCISKIESIYMSFYNVLPSGSMEGWYPGWFNKFATISAQTRYFDRSSPGAPPIVSVGFTNAEDPYGVLADMEGDDFVHGEDNVVDYRGRFMNDQTKTTIYKPISPVTLKPGDIVELSISFAAYEKKDKKYVFVPHLKSVLLLSSTHREKAAILRMRSRCKPDTSDTIIIKKRRNLYPDDEDEEARSKMAKLSVSEQEQARDMQIG
ncbi:hypothetical protein CPC08DRAFT_767817 [Agrocybe pediades]|nr:hypothetical protein CPC08DRAFT_767817 [Agrocybe pediades]